MITWYEKLFITIVLSCVFSIACKADSIKVMVIDTGVNLTSDVKSYVKEPQSDAYVDRNGHGTLITSLIVKDVCTEVEVISCKYWENKNKDTMVQSKRCLREAIAKNVNYINYSSAGIENDVEEKKLFQTLSDKGVVFTVAAGNDNVEVKKNVYPASYRIKNMFVIGALDNFGNKRYYSNYASFPEFKWELGTTGTSDASARYMNKLLKKKCNEIRK